MFIKAAAIAALTTSLPTPDDAWCPPMGDASQVYTNTEVVFPENWSEFQQGKKPVIIGITEVSEEVIGNIAYKTCRLVIEYQDLEPGEGVMILGDNFDELMLGGQFYDPYRPMLFVAGDACELIN